MNVVKQLKKIPHLRLITRSARKYKSGIWLVGGFLRDSFLMSRAGLCDFDFCVEKNTALVSREFARSLSSKCIVLDADQESLRVIIKKKKAVYNYDFTRIRGKDLLKDLALRDFSINTLAVDLLQKDPKLIDSYGARKDLKRKIIRIISDEVILQDPLRILRGFSFMAKYGFRIEPGTRKAMCEYKQALKRVSRERVHEELFKILACSRSFPVMRLMDRMKIIDEFIPYIDKSRGVFQGDYHHLDVWEHSLETLRQFELLCRRLRRDRQIQRYLDEEIAPKRSRIQVLKLACLLHDIGKPFAKKRLKKKTIFHTHEKIGRDLAEEIALALRFSLREKEILKKLIFWHLRPGYLADQITPSRRAVYRFFRDTQEEGVGIILLSLSDWRATRGPLTDSRKRSRHEKIMLSLIREHFRDKARKPLPKIVDGYDIMRRFKLKSSPLVGEILRKIKEEQALGKVSGKGQAYRIARRLLERYKK
jgi:poly(A) polymerase